MKNLEYFEYLVNILQLYRTLLDSEKAEGTGNRNTTRPLRNRAFRGRQDYWESPWGRMLRRFEQENIVEDLQNNELTKFRRRFRIPYEMFRSLMEKFEQEDYFTSANGDINAAGVPAAPLELKVLGALKVLGNGIGFDVLPELNGISEETNRVFFHKFCKVMAEKLFAEYVIIPQDPNEIKRIADLYSRLGFPGACGSIDCVHLQWDMCPAMEKNLYTGKEGYPSVTYECIVTHEAPLIFELCAIGSFDHLQLFRNTRIHLGF